MQIFFVSALVVAELDVLLHCRWECLKLMYAIFNSFYFVMSFILIYATDITVHCDSEGRTNSLDMLRNIGFVLHYLRGETHPKVKILEKRNITFLCSVKLYTCTA